MQWFRNSRSAIQIAVILGGLLGSAVICGAVPQWQQWLDSASAANAALYRTYAAPRRSVSVPRPPAEAAPDLARLSDARPSDAELAEWAAREYEAALDFSNAEARWKQAASLSADPASGQVALADYYHRRLQTDLEMTALIEAARMLPAIDDPLTPDNQQRAWRIYERTLTLSQDEALSTAVIVDRYASWIAKYPQAASVYRRFFDALVANAMLSRAGDLITDYEKTFPNDRVFSIDARAALARARGSAADAIAYYDTAFDPLWPRDTIDRYFKLLGDSGRLYAFFAQAQRAAHEHPLDVGPAARLYWYDRKRNDEDGARRELSQFRLRKEASGTPWTASELKTLAALSESAGDHAEVVRYNYALYSLSGADDSTVEAALAEIIATLLDAPGDNIPFGRGSLSFYRDIATMDSSPGFLNGILSLILNSQEPKEQFEDERDKANTYFHRTKAAELYTLFVSRFPNSARTPELLSKLIDEYETYGSGDAVIQNGQTFLARFSAAPQRAKVSMQMANAYARRNQTVEELSIYDRALADLAMQARQVPLGSAEPRSADYAKVLDRYVSRLVALQRIDDALTLYRKEIDRNPNDPGLYDRLANFLEQNQRAPGVEEVYQKAVAQFPGNAWWNKLARFYLRQQRISDLDSLSQRIANDFSGSDLESYVAGITADNRLDRRAALQITVYAHQRFPHDMDFVHRLMSFYADRNTANAPELTGLLQQYWFEDEQAREMYFQRLSMQGALDNLIAGTRTADVASNPAMARFVAEAEAWQSHFESAAPIAQALAAAYPADPVIANRAADLFRSLSYAAPANTAIAASIAENLALAAPRDRQARTRLGEIHADRGDLVMAKTAWDRLPEIDPGKQDSYLDTATDYWDYFQYTDALRWLQAGREHLKNPNAWGYQEGSILEAQDRPADAVSEYLRAALAPAPDNAAHTRLVRLSTRPEYHDAIEIRTADAVKAAPDDAAALGLRVDVLKEQHRFRELDSVLTGALRKTAAGSLLDYIADAAANQSLVGVQERVLMRRIAIESSPEEKLRLGLNLVRFYEDAGNAGPAAREMESIYKANSLIAGVIRDASDFYWRRGERDRTIRILTDAAQHADPSLKGDYLREAARKAIDAARYDNASKLADTLLAMDPLAPESVTLKAEALARQNRPDEVRRLYLAKIDEIRKSKTPDRNNAAARLRRELIPVLVRMNDFAGAIDQYIEIMNAFPEDDGLVREAARLASQHTLQSRLIDYYNRTIAAAPRDARWAIVLARIQTAFENYPAAIAAYTNAIAARPERLDLAEAQGDLEERTSRFTDAIATYQRIFNLSHGDPQWLERTAIIQARLGRNAEAASTLRHAYVDDLPESSRRYARAAEVLEQCGLIEEAAGFMEQQAAADTGIDSNWLTAYARIMTRARKQTDAFGRAFAAKRLSPLQAMGNAVRDYFTPEEKEAFAAFLSSQESGANSEKLMRFVAVAKSAGLYDLSVTWALDHIAITKQPWECYSVVQLEEQRMRFSELGPQLERLAAGSSDVTFRNFAQQNATEEYRKIGDTTAELRLLMQNGNLASPQRFYELLAASDPERLVAIAAGSTGPNDRTGDLAIQALLDSGNAPQSLAAVQARSASRPPVWVDAHTGLAGIYFGLDRPEIGASFERVLGSMTIGDRIGKPVDRTRQLAGETWFYYGARYGEYLDSHKKPQAADYIESEVEQHPGETEAYGNLARYYQDSGNPVKALADYRLALQIDPARADIQGEAGVALWDSGNHAGAIATWNSALAVAQKQLEQPPPRAMAADRAAALLRSIRSRQQLDAVWGTVDALLRSSLPLLNPALGTPLIQSVFESSTNTARFADALRIVQNPIEFLSALSNSGWLNHAQTGLVLEAAVDGAARQMSGLSRAPDFQLENSELRQQYIQFLLDDNLPDRAQTVLDSFSPGERRIDNEPLVGFALRVAALTGHIPALLEQYVKNPGNAPNDSVLRSAAMNLEQHGLPEARKAVLEFVYRRQIDRSGAGSAAYMGLAEVLLGEGNPDSAIRTLQTVNLSVGSPFENLRESAAILLVAGRTAEAEDFLKLRVQAAPWDNEARLDFDRTRHATGHESNAVRDDLTRLAASSSVRYEIRAAAAKLLAETAPGTADLGSRELNLLSGRGILDETSAGSPYFFAARTIAAARASNKDIRLRLLLDALAENPDDNAVRVDALRAAVDAGRNETAAALGSTLIESDFGFGGRKSVSPETIALIADAEVRLGRFSEAIPLYTRALSSEKNVSLKQAYAERQKAAEAANARRTENERRRPAIGPNLEQPNFVGRMQ